MRRTQRPGWPGSDGKPLAIHTCTRHGVKVLALESAIKVFDLGKQDGAFDIERERIGVFRHMQGEHPRSRNPLAPVGGDSNLESMVRGEHANQ